MRFEEAPHCSEKKVRTQKVHVGIVSSPAPKHLLCTME
jgi:hypothetical protein